MEQKKENDAFEMLCNAERKICTPEEAKHIIRNSNGISAIENMEYTEKEDEISYKYLTGEISREEYYKAFYEANK